MNNNNSILLVDQEFDPNAITNRNLLFKITADSFSYAMLNMDAGRLEVLYDQQDCDPAVAMAKRIKTDPYLSIDFAQVKISVCSANTLTVPEAFYLADQPEIYANYFTELADFSGTLQANSHVNYDFKTLFLLPGEVEKVLTDNNLGSAIKYGQTAPLLAMLRPAERDQLVLDFTGSSFYAMLFKQGKLIFQNYYTAENDEEFNYYLLLIVQQLKLDPAQTDLLATGIINAGDTHYDIMERYFLSVEILEPILEDTDLTILEDMPKHYYTSLLAINLCA